VFEIEYFDMRIVALQVPWTRIVPIVIQFEAGHLSKSTKSSTFAALKKRGYVLRVGEPPDEDVTCVLRTHLQ